MIEITKLLESLPPMLSGNELYNALQVLPSYSDEIRSKSAAERLMALSDLYSLYVPSPMSQEIYYKLYLSLIRSLQKKCSQIAVRQRYENHQAILKQNIQGILGGADSFTIIGISGIGKSSAISRAISLVTENRIIEIEQPYTKIIPCMIVQCPHDSSVKGLLLEIIRKVDEELGSTYYKSASKSRVTVDVLIGSVSSIALNHIGMLIVDEIQNVANSKNGKTLIGSLTQLINNSGISIALVGTPEAAVFFQQAMQLARRSVGLSYTTMAYDDYFVKFCEIIFQYQYVREKTELSPALMEWLYEHSGGNISILVALLHDAQEVAILNSTEILDISSLNEAYRQRLSFLHGYINPGISKGKQCSKVKKASRHHAKDSHSNKYNSKHSGIGCQIQSGKHRYCYAIKGTLPNNRGCRMIAFLPQIYPDELVYSWFARYYVHAGYLSHKAALQELLAKRCNNPSKEFIG